METSDFLLILATFLAAGTVKGVIGLGLPTVSLGLLTVAFDLPSAMALLIVPSLVTNLLQAITGGQGRAILARIWPFLLMATLAVWIGTRVLIRVDLNLMSSLLGLLLIAYAIIGLVGFQMSMSRSNERWAGPVLGLVNGILTGMTGSFIVPGVMFLQSIRLQRDALIQAMGILFAVSTLALAIALQRNGLVTGSIGLASTLALVPALIGMWLGRGVRARLSEAIFRKVFFAAILLLGAYILIHAILGNG
ncbi:sulfite exporter tauE/safE-like protein (plasmid) [Phaeobacter gallaeciensis]|jgi:uncharacterized membrane protein YfcA|uniref:Probable membrane transporter protein n=1 Tax=Phaeobacter gallaeciensis TaxID=60890 RepID=A0AAC9ZDA1_9RHOB|nr:sulfite exporter TauE/SafE family protein [Phaeobacter gallaeciensis]ATF04044.1 sulfite exporter tauE/safE-like protein [Phaeobacter gallaeciensis]ATF08320.1 sulfite exporter tauE/safE-like protein [Phaeobacter gallaeciensis]